MVCFNCNSEGHKASDCTEPKKSFGYREGRGGFRGGDRGGRGTFRGGNRDFGDIRSNQDRDNKDLEVHNNENNTVSWEDDKGAKTRDNLDENKETKIGGEW